MGIADVYDQCEPGLTKQNNRIMQIKNYKEKQRKYF
jgi:hypothetical protein